MAAIVTFLTDYGLDDPFVGLCHAVMAHLAPEVRVIDLTHSIAASDVGHGALLLADCIPYLPPAAHLAVVDPGVGTVRRGVVVAAGEAFLVGPDNGLLWPAAVALGGPRAAWKVHVTPNTGWQPATTFDGRDRFAPVAARLAAGDPPDQYGPPLDVDQLVRHELPVADFEGGALSALVVHSDRFGNVQLGARAADVPGGWSPGAPPLRVEAGGAVHDALRARTFADAPRGELLCYVDAFGRLALAVSDGDAARRLGVRRGSRIHLFFT